MNAIIFKVSGFELLRLSGINILNIDQQRSLAADEVGKAKIRSICLPSNGNLVRPCIAQKAFVSWSLNLDNFVGSKLERNMKNLSISPIALTRSSAIVNTAAFPNFYAEILRI